MCRLVGTVPDIVGLVWPSFRPKSDSKSKISGRVLKSVRCPFSLAELSRVLKSPMSGGVVAKVGPEIPAGRSDPKFGGN